MNGNIQRVNTRKNINFGKIIVAQEDFVARGNWPCK